MGQALVRVFKDITRDTVKVLGRNGPAPIPPFDPSTLSLSAWIRANYPGSCPWPGQASTGNSGAEPFITSGFDPSVGSALNGFDTASFDGGSQSIKSTSANNALWHSVGSLWILCYPTVTPASNVGAEYLDCNLLIDGTNAETGVGYSSNGFVATIYSGGAYSTVVAPCLLNAWSLCQMKFDSANLQVRVNGGVWTTTSCGVPSYLVPSQVRCGIGYGSVNKYTGLIAEIGMSSTVLSNTDFDNIKSYINTRYALSL